MTSNTGATVPANKLDGSLHKEMKQSMMKLAALQIHPNDP